MPLHAPVRAGEQGHNEMNQASRLRCPLVVLLALTPVSVLWAADRTAHEPAAHEAAVRKPAAREPAPGDLPVNLRWQEIFRQHLHTDGIQDDLLTAGLGATGLQGAQPAFADAAAPTPAEIRRRTLYNQYRALLDVSSDGGFGRLYGPSAARADGRTPERDGRIAGEETVALLQVDALRVQVMLQVPASFAAGLSAPRQHIAGQSVTGQSTTGQSTTGHAVTGKSRPCLVLAPASGSRGVYGAVPTVGEWALKRGCAVAYHDKAAGAGWAAPGARADSQAGAVGADGRWQHAEAAVPALFAVPIPVPTPDANPHNRDIGENGDALLSRRPHALALKHAHAQQNPESQWGRLTLISGEWALRELRRRYRQPFAYDDITIIAASISNGGQAVLRAAEQDTRGLIDAVVASEPNVSVADGAALRIRQNGVLQPRAGVHAYEHFTLTGLYLPCAALSLPPALLAALPDVVQAGAARCQWLQEQQLLSGADQAAQARAAAGVLISNGILPETLLQSGLSLRLKLFEALGPVYANAYARTAFSAPLCAVSFAAAGTDGRTRALTPAERMALYSDNAGVAPGGGVQLQYADGESLGADAARVASAQKCFHDLAYRHGEVQSGMRAVTASADLRAKPAIIVHGRSDALVPVNHSSRAYVARARQQGNAELRYYEVSNAHHFDALNALPGFNISYVPLHVYFNAALDVMLAHLHEGKAPPASQLIVTTARKLQADGKVEALNAAHVPRLAEPEPARAIRWQDATLHIP